MFGSAAQGATKTKSLLPAVQELPGHQKASEAQAKATKNPGHWSTFEKFKIDTKKHGKPAAQVAPPEGKGNTGQNQGLQTHTRRTTKDLK